MTNIDWNGISPTAEDGTLNTGLTYQQIDNFVNEMLTFWAKLKVLPIIYKNSI